MQVKIGSTWYDAEKEPIMVVLTLADVENIKNMLGRKYCAYPDDSPMTHEEALAFMEVSQE